MSAGIIARYFEEQPTMLRRLPKRDVSLLRKASAFVTFKCAFSNPPLWTTFYLRQSARWPRQQAQRICDWD